MKKPVKRRKKTRNEELLDLIGQNLSSISNTMGNIHRELIDANNRMTRIEHSIQESEVRLKTLIIEKAASLSNQSFNIRADILSEFHRPGFFTKCIQRSLQ